MDKKPKTVTLNPGTKIREVYSGLSCTIVQVALLPRDGRPVLYIVQGDDGRTTTMFDSEFEVTELTTDVPNE
jgi:hypothetical protein